MFIYQFVEYDLCGNLEDGTDNNGGRTIKTIRSPKERSERNILAIARSNFEGFALPKDETSNVVLRAKRQDIEIEWSDETHADIVWQGVYIGCVYVENQSEPPEKLTAYVGRQLGHGTHPITGVFSFRKHEVTDFQGKALGTCVLASKWRVNSYVGTHMYQVYAVINGHVFTGRSFGESMSVNLRLVRQ
jgi:hypothetical protein